MKTVVIGRWIIGGGGGHGGVFTGGGHWGRPQ